MALIVAGTTLTGIIPGNIGFSAYKTSTTSNYSSGSWHTITFQGEYFDSNGLYNTGDGVCTITSATAGKWVFGYSVQAEFAGGGAERDQNYFCLLHNDAGTGNRWQNAHEMTDDYHEKHGASQTIIVDMQNTDDMQVQYYHNSGSSNGYINGGNHGNRTANFWGYRIST